MTISSCLDFGDHPCLTPCNSDKVRYSVKKSFPPIVNQKEISPHFHENILKCRLREQIHNHKEY